MKNFVNVIRFFALAAVILFSIAACGDDAGSEGNAADADPLLEGSWYSIIWKETYTFNPGAKTYTLIKDSGSGEKGAFTTASATFICTATHITADGINWIPSGSQSEKTKAYNFSGNTLFINGQEYTKTNSGTDPGTDPGDIPGTPPVGIVSPYHNVNWNTYGQYKAGMHVHTSRSDDSQALFSDMIEHHYANGYDIMAITDHNVINRDWTSGENALTETRYNEIITGADRGDKGMLRIPYTDEQSMGDHVLTFFADFNNPAFSTLRSNIQKAEELGGLSHINHPGRYTSDRGDRESDIKRYSDILMEFPSCLGIEVMNMNDRHPNDRILWDNVLKVTMRRGYNAWCFANDDAHSTSMVGNSFNMIIMPENNLDNFRSALINGNFYAVGRVAKTELGQSFSASGPAPRITNIVVNNTELSITISAENHTKIVWIANGTEIAEGGTLAIGDHEGVITYYVRANIIGPGGIAFTQPFAITY